MERRELRSVDPATFLPERAARAFVPRPRIRQESTAQAKGNSALEIAVFYELAQVGADLGEDLHVEDCRGRIRVTGLVENRRRKEEILRGLEPLLSNSEVVAELQTLEDSARSNSIQKFRTALPVLVEKLQATSSRVPLDGEIRHNLGQLGIAEADLDEAVERFSSEVVRASLSGLQHARALQKITSRFDARQLSEAPPAAKMEWLAIVLRHAEALQDRNLFLASKLASVTFVRASSGPESPANIGDREDLRAAAQQLLDISVLNDESLASGFSIPLNATQAAPVQWGSLQGSLSQALSLSSRILAAATRVEAGLREAEARFPMHARPDD